VAATILRASRRLVAAVGWKAPDKWHSNANKEAKATMLEDIAMMVIEQQQSKVEMSKVKTYMYA